MAEVIPLYPDRPSIAQYVRVGTTGHNQLEALLESGRLTQDGRLWLDRAVLGAAAAPRQTSLMRALADRGAELILDTDVAELSSPGRFEGAVRQAPWAIGGQPLQLDDWTGGRGYERIMQIARFAVEHRFRTVLAPTHLLTGHRDRAFESDRSVLERLRHALDDVGGAGVALDYPLLIPNRILRDPVERAAFINALRGQPFDNLWLRIAGFGVDATPVGVRRYISALREFAELGHPIVADGVAGLAGLATVAFGAAGGLAHGVGVLERFDTRSWSKRPEKKSKGGAGTRALVTMLDRQLKVEEVKAIAAVSGGSRLVSCADTKCCRRGLTDTLHDPKPHYLYQRRAPIEALSRVPESRRAEHYLSQILTPADRHNRMLNRLKIVDPKLKKILHESGHRVEQLLHVLEDFHIVSASDGRRASSPKLRKGEPSQSASAQR